MTLLIKGGTVVSTTGADPLEVLVDGERIVALLEPDSTLARSAEGGGGATGAIAVNGPHIGMRHFTRSIGAALTYGWSATHIGASGDA